jgi:hypothetical protein
MGGLNMKKILPILVIGILVLSGLGAAAVNNNLSMKRQTINQNSTNDIEKTILSFSSVEIEESNRKFLDINLKDTTSYLTIPGEPVLPKVIKIVELPFGVGNVQVDVKMDNVNEKVIDKEIRPASPHIPLIATTENYKINYEKNEKIYSSEKPYPNEWYSYKVKCGLNENNERTTKVIIDLYPVKYAPKLNKIITAENAEIKITYDSTKIKTFSTQNDYELVIIAPRIFSFSLKRLVDHKNSYGIRTNLEKAESIYRNYKGVDKPEKIKRFIQHEIENHNIKYVLLVGGLKSQIWGNPRENKNYGAKDWYVPVRYHNFWDDPEHPLSMEKIHDPGVISDLYFADVYKEGGEFEDWDSNDDGIIGAWNYPDENVENDTLDLVPDISVGRLACRNLIEVRDVVDKIINYEKTAHNKDWFKKAVVVSGDGFMDQDDLDFQWNTSDLPNGEYTIYAQSRTDNKPFGVPDKIHISIKRSVGTELTFNHDDHLRIDGYPTEPIADIVSVSDGDILGFNDSTYEPSEGEAYGNSFNGWANVNFTKGILHIRGKTYDPSPYGNITDIHVWILNEEGETVFDEWRYGQEMYYEGEWITGEKTLKGGGGALYYLPEDFEKEIIWASNGKLKGPDDIMDGWNPGCGFLFISGHGSPSVWTDHFPGIPGNRRHGSIPAIRVVKWGPKALAVIPTFPLSKLQNKDKLPILLVGGCHNSQINVSMIYGLIDRDNSMNSWCHGTPVPECFSWYPVKLRGRGAIASLGNTGLGYGTLGKDCLIEGLDGGICIEFFKQYANLYEENGSAILGDVYLNTLLAYCNLYDIYHLDHAKSLTQWILLGDPSLMIGGYS